MNVGLLNAVYKRYIKQGIVLMLGLIVVQPVWAETKFVIGFSQSTVYESWRIMFNQSLRQATDEYPEIELLIADGQDQAPLQARDILNFVEQSVDAIIVAPKSDPLIIAAVNHAFLKQIPIIVIDNLLPDMQYTQFIGVDNVGIGRAAALRVIETIAKMNGSRTDKIWRVMELCGHADSSVTKDRHEGFIQQIAAQKDKRIEFNDTSGCEYYGDWKQDQARSVMRDLLNAEIAADFIFAHNDQMAFGAYIELANINKMKQLSNVHLIGVDALPTEGMQWVKDDVLTATYTNPIDGSLVLQQILHILEGDDFPKTLYMPSEEVIKSVLQ